MIKHVLKTLVAVLAIATAAAGPAWGQSNPTKYTSAVAMSALQVGDTLFDDAGKAAVGVIESIETEQAQTVGYMPDGTAVLAPIEDRLDVTLTLRAQGVPEKDFYKVGTYEIKVNQTSLYFTKYSIWSGRVVSIEAGS